MKERFYQIIEKTLLFECGKGNGYANVKGDNGGITFMGVTRKAHPNIKVWESLDKLNACKRKTYKPTEEERDEIINVYKTNYYLRNNLDKLNNDDLALNVFDMCVNAGKWGIILLQRLVGVKQDGICGLQTITTANNKSSKRMVEAYRELRRGYYRNISTKGQNKKFLKGWLNRVDSCIMS